MRRRTQQYLDLAGDNLTLAQTLLQRGLAGLTRPPTLEWAALAAFYAAGNYIDAYLNEIKDVDASSLAARLTAMGADPLLIQGWPVSALGAYLHLRHLHTAYSYYPPRGAPAALRLRPTAAHEAVHVYLAAVMKTVCSAVGAPPPELG